MTESLRILILEDNPADADLIQFELQEAGIIFTANVATNENDYVQAIQDYCPDLILSDYDLPKYNGALALSEARRRCPDTPFILVTGAVTEDRAIDILTQGAKDYVLKTRLQQRLVPAVRRALAEAEEHQARKQAETQLREAHRNLEEKVKIRTAELETEMAARKKTDEALRESERQFRTLANSIPQLAWIARADGFIFWYNQRWYDYTGTTPGQMGGWGWQRVHDPKVLPEVMEKWKTAIATGEPFDMEFPLLGADKVFRPFLTRILPLKNEQGRVIQWFGTNTDLSERKRAEEELALNEREFRLLAESMPQIVWTTRVDGWNTYFNQKWVDYTGLTLEESYGHGWNKPFHPDDQQRAWDAWQNAVLHNAPYLLQCRLRRADGIYQWWLIHGLPVLDENGNIIKWYGTCTDINDLKLTEEAMLQSQNQFNLVIKNIRSGVALIDDTGKFTVVNPSFLRMFGLKDDETINNVNDKNWNDWQVFESDGTLLHVDEHPVRKAAITGKLVRDKLVGVRLPSGGDLIWMLISADLVRSPDGSIQSTICTYHDITERTRAEEALRKSEGKWSAALENLCIGAIIATEAEQVIYWNPVARAMHGFKSENEGIEPLEETPNTFELWTGDGAHQLRLEEWPMRRIKRGESVLNLELRLRRPDQGWEKFVLYSGEIVEMPSGERLIFLSVYDITEQKQAEKALVERTQQLEDANKELESFSYSVSHDLKAPLRAIEGYSRMLLKKDADKLSEDTRRKLDVIHTSIERMGLLIDDLLKFSRVLKDTMSIGEINVNKLVNEVWHDIRAANDERNLEIKIAELLPGFGDKHLIRQVILNLISNAVKFTKVRTPGLIEVSCYTEPGRVVYSVRDNGVGFDMANYDKLFGVFQRLHSAEEYEGTGVGLAIVHRIINRHGGRVWAEGEIDKGATFFFTLPTWQE